MQKDEFDWRVLEEIEEWEKLIQKYKQFNLPQLLHSEQNEVIWKIIKFPYNYIQTLQQDFKIYNCCEIKDGKFEIDFNKLNGMQQRQLQEYVDKKEKLILKAKKKYQRQKKAKEQKANIQNISKSSESSLQVQISPALVQQDIQKNE